MILLDFIERVFTQEGEGKDFSSNRTINQQNLQWAPLFLSSQVTDFQDCPELPTGSWKVFLQCIPTIVK